MINLLIFLFMYNVIAYNPEEPLLYDTFPNDFIWGAATAAYQVEFFDMNKRNDTCNIRLKEPGMRMGRVKISGMFGLKFLEMSLMAALEKWLVTAITSIQQTLSF